MPEQNKAAYKTEDANKKLLSSILSIGNWSLDIGASRLSNQQGEHKRLTPKTLQVLLILVENAGITVSRARLLEKVWKSSYPSDYVVSRAIADIRAAFGEEAKSASYIETVPKLGYRLVAKVSPLKQPLKPDLRSTSKVNAQYLSGFNKWLLITGVVLLFIVFVLVVANREFQTEVNIPIATPLTSELGLEQQPRISANADWLVYAALSPKSKNWNIYRQSFDGGSPRPIAISDFIEYGPAISPDDREVAYVRLVNGRCEVVVQPPLQSDSTVLSTCTNKFPTVVDWSPDGKFIAYTASADSFNPSRTIKLVERSSGAVTALTSEVPLDGTDYYPRFSPDGQLLAFYRGVPKPEHSSHILVIDLETKKQRQVTKIDSFHAGFSWLSESKIIYTVREAGRLVSKVVDLQTGKAATLKLRDVFQPDYHLKSQSLSMAKLRNNSDITLLNLNDKKISFVAESTANDWGGSLSPDGRWITFISTRTGSNQLWLVSTVSGVTRQLTSFEHADIRSPVWHADSETILFNVKQGAHRQLLTMHIISGDVQTLNTREYVASSARWLSKSASIVYSCKLNDVWKLCLLNTQTGKTVTVFDKNAYEPVISKDENYVYFTQDKPGLWRLELATGKVTIQWRDLPRTLGASWTVLNNIVYYLKASEKQKIVQIESRELNSGNTQILYQGALPSYNSSLDISRDGNWLVFSSWRAEQDDIVLFRPVSF